MKQLRRWCAFWAIASTVALAQPGVGGGPLRVVSAKRAQEYRSFQGQSLTATDTKNDVVLVLDLAGIRAEEFQKLPAADVYVMAGTRRCNPNISSSGTINGKPQILIAVVVPRGALKFTLFAGASRSVTFTAPQKIEPLVE